MTQVVNIHSRNFILPVCCLLLACGCSSDRGSGTNAESMAGTAAPTAGVMAQSPMAGTMAAGTMAPRPQPAVSPPVTVSGPVTSGMGKPFAFAVVDLGANGYSEKEYFFEGDATAYALQGQMAMNGKWALAETTKQHFKSRMLVRRPIDGAKFNGTVLVEWFNVTGGADADPGFIYNSTELIREGYAWVGVSAQAQGVVGGGFAFPIAGLVPLLQYDPERYGSLSHPGDAYSFDIYTRAAQIVRGAGNMDVLEGLKPKRLIAYGESQSAGRMVSYVDGVQPLTNMFDGFFIHSRGSSGVAFGAEVTLGPGLSGAPTLIRDDISVPVFQFQTETDVVGSLGFLSARQPDTDKLRTWEVAGTSHIDAYSLSLDTTGLSTSLGCTNANDGPQHYVVRAALHALERWIREGTAPVKGEPLMAKGDGSPLTDERGNTLGGVRTPDVDVPTAILSGLPASSGGASLICFLFGHTEPFTPQTLMQLYPSHDDYVSKVKDAARATREANFILVPEEQEMVAKAEAAPVPN